MDKEKSLQESINELHKALNEVKQAIEEALQPLADWINKRFFKGE